MAFLAPRALHESRVCSHRHWHLVPVWAALLVLGTGHGDGASAAKVKKSHIDTHGPVYVRHFVQSAPIDWLAPGTEVTIKYRNTGEKKWLCVTARGMSGKKLRGWIPAAAVPRKDSRNLRTKGTTCINAKHHCDDGNLACKWEAPYMGPLSTCNGNDDWPCFSHIQCRVKRGAGRVPLLYRPVDDATYEHRSRKNCDGGMRHGLPCGAAIGGCPGGGTCRPTLAINRDKTCTEGPRRGASCKRHSACECTSGECPTACASGTCKPCRALHEPVFAGGCGFVGVATDFFGKHRTSLKSFGREWLFVAKPWKRPAPYKYSTNFTGWMRKDQLYCDGYDSTVPASVRCSTSALEGAADVGHGPQPAEGLSTCTGRCCDGTTATILAEDDSSCLNEIASSGICGDECGIEQVQFDGNVVFQGACVACCAQCANASSSVTVAGGCGDCAEAADEYCSVAGRGGVSHADVRPLGMCPQESLGTCAVECCEGGTDEYLTSGPEECSQSVVDHIEGGPCDDNCGVPKRVTFDGQELLNDECESCCARCSTQASYELVPEVCEDCRSQATLQCQADNLGLVDAAWAGTCSNLCTPGSCQRSGPENRCKCNLQKTCHESGQCSCFKTADGGGFCSPTWPCASMEPCSSGLTCPEGFVCDVETCCDTPICKPLSAQCIPGQPPPTPPAFSPASEWIDGGRMDAGN